MPVGKKNHSPILMEVTRRPQALSTTPMLLAVTPFPSPLTTPPVTTTYFISLSSPCESLLQCDCGNRSGFSWRRDTMAASCGNRGGVERRCRPRHRACSSSPIEIPKRRANQFGTELTPLPPIEISN
jgi:hypothetical protein